MDLFDKNLKLIQKVTRSVCRKLHFYDEDAEDFQSSVYEKLLEDDCAALRKFKGESELSTFLFVTIYRLGLDLMDKKNGKWRNSRVARHLGATAMALETLLYRDGHTFEEAVRILRNQGFEESRQELEEMAGLLPYRPRRSFEGEGALEALSNPSKSPEEQALKKEEESEFVRAVEMLREELEKLDPEDRLILRLRYQDGLKIVAIANMLEIKQRTLYDRIKKLERELGAKLEERGISAEVIARILRER